MSKKFLGVPMVAVFLLLLLYLKFCSPKEPPPPYFKTAIASLEVANSETHTSDVYLLLSDFSLVPIKTTSEWSEYKAILNPSRNLLAVEEHRHYIGSHRIELWDGKNWTVLCTQCIRAVWISDREITYWAKSKTIYVPMVDDYQELILHDIPTGETEVISSTHWANRSRNKKIAARNYYFGPSPVKIPCGYLASNSTKGIFVGVQRPKSICQSTGEDKYYLVHNGELYEQAVPVVNIWSIE